MTRSDNSTLVTALLKCDDNTTVKGTKYQGTPELWEHLIMKGPDINIYTDNDRAE